MCCVTLTSASSLYDKKEGTSDGAMAFRKRRICTSFLQSSKLSLNVVDDEEEDGEEAFKEEIDSRL